jgi:hypothetical protein
MKNLYKYLESKRVKNIKNLMVFVVLALIFLSCSHQVQLPESATSATNPSQVSIFRENRFLGFGIPLTVMFDNKVICSLRTGEYVTFWVEPGFHTLGLSESIIKVPFIQGKKYYFLIKTYPDEFGFEIERIDDGIGNHLVTLSKVVE